jgi:DNA-binding response OmpR family regulator
LKRTVLIVEDDPAIATGLSMNLRHDGHAVLVARDGDEGLRMALGEPEPDLVILDIMIPLRNGFEVLEAVRRRGSRVPVLVLSAKGREADKVRALDLGADDYVTKPFGLQELLARVKALLRRTEPGGDRVVFGEVEVDLPGRRVTRAGREVQATPQEFRLLAHLIEHPGRACTRASLLDAAWGYDYEGTERTVDNFVRSLRVKLERDPEHPRHLVTVRGHGYRFDP